MLGTVTVVLLLLVLLCKGDVSLPASCIGNGLVLETDYVKKEHVCQIKSKVDEDRTALCADNIRWRFVQQLKYDGFLRVTKPPDHLFKLKTDVNDVVN